MKLLLVVLLAVHAWAKVDYSGYKVYRLNPRSDKDIAILWELKETYDTQVDFWREPVSAGQPVDIMVHPQVQDTLRLFLKRQSAYVMIQDVGQLMDMQTPSSDLQFLDTYNRYDDISEWLANACTAANNCELINIGQTYEGRNMWVSQIGGDTDKPIIFLECGIHAREWIAPAVCLSIINRLTVEGDDAMLNDYNFHIITNANPDGYEYTWTNDRLWRKTRSSTEGSGCLGADPNRNFDFQFGGAGTSGTPCSDIYRGAFAHSEIETANIRDYVRARESSIRAYYAVHSYGQWVLIPWSYARNTYPTDYSDLLRVANEGVSAIQANSGRTYIAGQSADLLGATAGCSDDWAKGTCGIKFAYTLELRDTGASGFLIPPVQIQPNFEEIWAAFIAMSDLMAAEYPGPGL